MSRVPKVPVIRFFPSSSVIEGKYKPGPNIWLQVGLKAVELQVSQAKELKRQLTYLLKLVGQ